MPRHRREKMRQRLHVFGAFAKGRHVETHDREGGSTDPRESDPREPPRADPDSSPRRSGRARARCDRPRPADLTALDRAKQHRLDVEGELANLVEQEGSPVGQGKLLGEHPPRP